MKRFLTGLAVGLATALYGLWLLFTHKRNKRDAEMFIASNHEERAQVLEDIGVTGTTFNERAESLRREVESHEKEELIEMFKGLFGVADSNDAFAKHSRTNDKSANDNDS